MIWGWELITFLPRILAAPMACLASASSSEAAATFSSVSLVLKKYQSMKRRINIWTTQYLTSKAIGCQWVCSSAHSFKTANPNEIKFWGMIHLWVQIVLGLKKICNSHTVHQKSKKN